MIDMSSQNSINSFSLTIEGLKINYTYNGQTVVHSFDPHSTCDLLQTLKGIEGFDTDRNGEPVILFTQFNCGRPSTGYALWYRFVQGFPFNERMAGIIVDHLESTKAFRKAHTTISRLHRPLQAA